jgi:hypothetical protein
MTSGLICPTPGAEIIQRQPRSASAVSGSDNAYDQPIDDRKNELTGVPLPRHGNEIATTRNTDIDFGNYTHPSISDFYLDAAAAFVAAQAVLKDKNR